MSVFQVFLPSGHSIPEGFASVVAPIARDLGLAAELLTTVADWRPGSYVLPADRACRIAIVHPNRLSNFHEELALDDWRRCFGSLDDDLKQKVTDRVEKQLGRLKIHHGALGCCVLLEQGLDLFLVSGGRIGEKDGEREALLDNLVKLGFSLDHDFFLVEAGNSSRFVHIFDWKKYFTDPTLHLRDCLFDPGRLWEIFSILLSLDILLQGVIQSEKDGLEGAMPLFDEEGHHECWLDPDEIWAPNQEPYSWSSEYVHQAAEFVIEPNAREFFIASLCPSQSLTHARYFAPPNANQTATAGALRLLWEQALLGDSAVPNDCVREALSRPGLLVRAGHREFVRLLRIARSTPELEQG